MTENNLYWESKIRFFSKFLGYDNVEDFDETLDETNKTQIGRRKGIKVVQTPQVYQSMVLPSTYSQEIDRKWLNLIRVSLNSASKDELLKLTSRGTCYPNKVMPWLAQNRCKINLKLYNLKRLQYRTSLNQNNPFRLQKMNSQLQILTLKQGHSRLAELLGVLLLLREDIQYSETLSRIGQTVDDYLFDAPVMAFSVLYFLCCRGAYLPFLTNDMDSVNFTVARITEAINVNCSSASFFRRDHISLHEYVRGMIESFWLNISEPKSPFRQKILFYLLINQVSLQAVSRLCEATIVGLSRILNQGNREKSVEVLSNPHVFLDREVFLAYLFS